MLPQEHILACINEPDVARFVSSCLHNELAQQYDLSVSDAHSIDKLLTRGESDPPDLFILLLNNMFYSYSSHVRHSGDEKMNRITHLLAVIVGLIVLSGCELFHPNYYEGTCLDANGKEITRSVYPIPTRETSLPTTVACDDRRQITVTHQAETRSE